MKILITGTSSGLGRELKSRLHQHDVSTITRFDLDLSDTSSVVKHQVGVFDMLINCAATGIGGKTDLINHNDNDIVNILNTNLLAPILLTKKALTVNSKCKIVNITSTNNNRYYPNDLIYSLSKHSLSEFGAMLKVEYPDIDLLEVRLGLTKTEFNNNRYLKEPDRFVDIYQNKHLTVDEVVDKLMPVLFDSLIKFVEISL